KIFLRLADGDGKMTAREMECFNELLKSRDWCRSSLFQQSLATTEAEKAELWKRYTAGEFRTAVDQVAASLYTVLGSIAPEERADMERDLLQLCRRVRKAARSGVGLLWGDDEGKTTFEALTELIKRPSARSAQREPAKSPVEAQASTLNLGSLLAGNVSAEMFWQRGKLRLRCIQVLDETHDVKTFRFVSEPPKLFRYQAGQFVTLVFP